MKQLFKKLNSSSGASMVLTLVFLLICLGVGAMILTSASVNINKQRGAEEEQRSYLSVSSAARLLRDAYGNTECYMSESRTEYTCGIHGDFTSPAVKDETNKLTEAAYDTFRHSSEFAPETAGFKTDTFTVSADSAEMEDVSVTFRMADDYTAVFVLAPAGKTDYAMTLAFTASVNAYTQYENGECSHTETDAKTGDEYDVYYPYTVKTNSVSVVWDGGEITKGAA